MKLSRESVYVLGSLKYLGQQEKGVPSPSHMIAKEIGAPERFLVKVLKPLVQAGIVQSLAGPKGGYRLARHLKEFTLFDVLKATQGDIDRSDIGRGLDVGPL